MVCFERFICGKPVSCTFETNLQQCIGATCCHGMTAAHACVQGRVGWHTALGPVNLHWLTLGESINVGVHTYNDRTMYASTPSSCSHPRPYQASASNPPFALRQLINGATEGLVLASNGPSCLLQPNNRSLTDQQINWAHRSQVSNSTKCTTKRGFRWFVNDFIWITITLNTELKRLRKDGGCFGYPGWNQK